MMTSSTNAIIRIETKSVNTNSSAIMVSLDIYNKKAADNFIKEVLEKVLMQRMISPPNTDMLCITIVGDMKAQEFKSLWKKHMQSEIPMKMFMDQMKVADAIHGSQDGKVLDQVSLIK